MTRNRAVFFMLLMIVSVALSACGIKRPPSYAASVKDWTRYGVFYGHKDFFAKLQWQVTYLSPAYLHARLAEYAEKMQLSETEKAAYWTRTLSAYSEQPTFFISLYTQFKGWNELDSKKDPVWRLLLRQGDTQCEPQEIKRLKRLTPEEDYFFPYVERWDVPYFITFAPECASASTPIHLSIDGLYGHSTLTWK